VKAYAHDLGDFFAFLGSRELDWARVTLEDVGRFVAWLRLADEARGGGVTLLPCVEGNLCAATVNRKLSALASFYEFHQRHGVDLADLLTQWRPGGRGGSWRSVPRPPRVAPGATPGGGAAHRTAIVAGATGVEMATLIEACTRLRDRFLLSLLRGCGLRIGEALGLRHEDVDSRRGLISVRQRRNVNGARAKTWSREVPADAGLIRLYSDYLHEEYGALDCDYIFVNLWVQPLGYASVDRLTRRLRVRTGIEFTPHQFRHSYVADLLRGGVGVEVVQHLLGYASISTMIDTYGHLGVEDARRALVAAGLLAESPPTGSEVGAVT